VSGGSGARTIPPEVPDRLHARELGRICRRVVNAPSKNQYPGSETANPTAARLAVGPGDQCESTDGDRTRIARVRRRRASVFDVHADICAFAYGIANGGVSFGTKLGRCQKPWSLTFTPELHVGLRREPGPDYAAPRHASR